MFGRQPVSSVYSDPFGLERLARPLPRKDPHRGNQEKFPALISQRDSLRRELEQARSAWLSMHRMMMKVAEVVEVLSKVQDDAQRHMDVERKKWLANCTAI